MKSQEVTVLSKCSSLFPPQIQNPVKSMYMMQGHDCFSIALVFQCLKLSEGLQKPPWPPSQLKKLQVREKNRREKIKLSSHVLPRPPLPWKEKSTIPHRNVAFFVNADRLCWPAWSRIPTWNHVQVFLTWPIAYLETPAQTKW